MAGKAKKFSIKKDLSLQAFVNQREKETLSQAMCINF